MEAGYDSPAQRESLNLAELSLCQLDARLIVQETVGNDYTHNNHDVTVALGGNSHRVLTDIYLVGKEELTRDHTHSNPLANSFFKVADYISHRYHEQRKITDMNMTYSEVQTTDRKKTFPSLRIRPTLEAKKRFDELSAKYSVEVAAKTLVGEAMDEINAVTERPRTELSSGMRKRTGPLYSIQYGLPAKPHIGNASPSPSIKAV